MEILGALIFFVERIEQEHGKRLATVESKQDVLRRPLRQGLARPARGSGKAG